jgi:hypothetical protein
MTEPETNGAPTCGEEVAASAEVSEAWRDLVRHVAINLDSHATWVGASSPAARDEQDGLRRVAAAFRDMAEAAERAVVLMRSLRALPPAEHDPTTFDHGGFVAWMREKIERQRALAALLERHAAAAAAAIEGGP